MGGHSNRELNEKTGCIGYLTANLNASAPEFESSWRDRTPKLNTPEFTDDFNDMIDTLRQGMLKYRRNCGHIVRPTSPQIVKAIRRALKIKDKAYPQINLKNNIDK